MVTKSELNVINRVEAINTIAMTVEAYIFNIVDWKLEEIRRLDRKARKLLTLQRMHYPKADVNGMYYFRKESSRGLIQLEITYKTATKGLNTYLNTKK